MKFDHFPAAISAPRAIGEFAIIVVSVLCALAVDRCFDSPGILKKVTELGHGQ